MYTREEELKIYARVGVTKEAYELLRTEKKKRGESMAKIVCNLIVKNLSEKIT